MSNRFGKICTGNSSVLFMRTVLNWEGETVSTGTRLIQTKKFKWMNLSIN